jgi:hypothetical protein
MRIQADKSKERAASTANAISKTPGTEAKALVDNRPVQKKTNKTGLPNNLKSGIENLSGQSLDDVRVHYNSAQPAQLNAHAYAQGSNIHVAPGQEKHLPHEAWHVVQQKQGRVKPTLQMKSINVNYNEALEHEADTMGGKALGDTRQAVQPKVTGRNSHQFVQLPGVAQLAKKKKAKKKSPKALGYKSLTGAKRLEAITGFKQEQRNLGRGRVHHVRHIIPHSDLQNWMLVARQKGNAASTPGLVRRKIKYLLRALGHAVLATNWQTAYHNYEASGTNKSFLQYNSTIIAAVWAKIEWSPRNTFLGQSGINMAIQNRFDGGNGGLGKSRLLYNIWRSINALLGLAPTSIVPTRIFAVQLNSYIKVLAASHSGSRAVQAATGLIHRSEYQSHKNYINQL